MIRWRTPFDPACPGTLEAVIDMSVRNRIFTFFGLLILGSLSLITGVAIMIERLSLGPNGGPVALGLFVASIVLAPLSFWVLISGPKKGQ